MMMFGFFFFSSRRRHTRFDCDWSSDVCSSDLGYSVQMTIIPQIVEFLGYDTATAQQFVPTVIIGGGGSTPSVPVTGQLPPAHIPHSVGRDQLQRGGRSNSRVGRFAFRKRGQAQG